MGCILFYQLDFFFDCWEQFVFKVIGDKFYLMFDVGILVLN